MQLFLSYSRHDAAFALQLTSSLEALGHSVWIDTEDIVGSGEDLWRRSIVNGIVACDVVVLVLSPNSVTSQNVEREITVAAEKQKRIVPVLYQPCELPSGFMYELAGVQRIDFTELSHEEAVSQLDRFLQRLGSQPASANLPTTPPVQARVPVPVGLVVPRPPLPRSRGRQSRNVLIGTGVGAVAVIVLIAALASGGNDKGSTDPTSPTVLRQSEAPVATSGTEPTGTEPTAVVVPTSPQPSTTVDSLSQQAIDIVRHWAAESTARNWDAVRAISVPEQNKDLDGFNSFYGASTDPRHMETLNAYITGASAQSSNLVVVNGAVIAWDFYFEDSRVVGDPPLTTNTGCREWVVDVSRGKILEAKISHDPGLSGGDRVYEQIKEPDFPTLYATYCHAAG